MCLKPKGIQNLNNACKQCFASFVVSEKLFKKLRRHSTLQRQIFCQKNRRDAVPFFLSQIFFFFFIKVDCTMNIMQECLKFSQTGNVHTYIQLFQSMRCTFASAKEKQQQQVQQPTVYPILHVSAGIAASTFFPTTFLEIAVYHDMIPRLQGNN